MKTNRLTLYILLPVTVLILLGAFLAGSACAPPGTIPRSCEQWYEKGKLEGYNTGYDKGYGRGKDAGYNEGYTKGLHEGMALCPQCPTCPTCPTCPQYPEYSYPYYSPYFYWDHYSCPWCEPSP
ncbi:MAG: hypothetical protein WCA51_03395 [Dehalococcoidia bacterium]